MPLVVGKQHLARMDGGVTHNIQLAVPANTYDYAITYGCLASSSVTVLNAAVPGAAGPILPNQASDHAPILVTVDY